MHDTLRTLKRELEEALSGPRPEVRVPELLADVQPYDLAEALDEWDEPSARRVLSLLEPAWAAEVLEHMDYLKQYRLLHHLNPETARQILDQMSSDAVVDLCGAIHPRQVEQLLALLTPDYRATIRHLMAYPEHTAGGRMTIDYISVRQHMTAEEVLEHIRKVGREAETVSYIYAVDPAGRLVGVMSLRELILAPRDTPVSEIMNTAVISVPVTMDQEEVARVVSHYDLVAVPVVNEKNQLLGIVTVDDVIDVIQEEATEDVLRMGASAAPEDLAAQPLLRSVWALAKPRLPWLLGLLFLEMGSSLIVERFSGLVAPSVAVMLALFTVVMAGESGNAATQALAVVVRGLATGEITPRDLPKVVFREALVGLVVGGIVGAALMVTGWLWQGSAQFGFAVGLALMANLFIAKVLGGLFPVLIFRLGIDPAVASGPFITTLTDNSSMLIYYGVAALILRTFG
jgi:magnesium transporter